MAALFYHLQRDYMMEHGGAGAILAAIDCRVEGEQVGAGFGKRKKPGDTGHTQKSIPKFQIIKTCYPPPRGNSGPESNRI